MHFAFNFTFSNATIEGVIFLVSAVFIWLSLSKVRRTGQVAHLRWLVPMAVYITEEAVTYAVENIYTTLTISEPSIISTIVDVADDVGLLAFLWALIVLWRMIRKSPELLQMPWPNRSESPEGVWPPAPKV